MRHPDQYAGLFCFILGGAITLSSFYYEVGSLAEPGPGFITFLAGSFLTILSVMLLLSSWRNKEVLHLRQIWEGQQTGKAFYVLLLLAVYMLVVTPLGFLISTFFLLVLLFRVQGTYSLKTLMVLSALTTSFSFIIFDQWLGVQLPRGFMGYFLF